MEGSKSPAEPFTLNLSKSEGYASSADADARAENVFTVAGVAIGTGSAVDQTVSTLPSWRFDLSERFRAMHPYCILQIRPEGANPLGVHLAAGVL